MNPLYTRTQIVYALNALANSPSGMHGTVAELEAHATEVITAVLSNAEVVALIGAWDLAWGPCVYQTQGSTVADNAMYVARSKTDASQIVVAISGTNPISWFGWLVEDLMINPPVPWSYGEASPSVKGKITHGTDVGLGILLGTLADDGQTLMAYLAAQVSESSAPLSITVTGHSLGGALSPATALALLDTQGIPLGEPNGWDPGATSTISVQPSAGPTPGDVTWRDYYDGRLGARTDRQWNAIDVVPHAWQVNMLAEVPGLYVPTIPENPVIQGFVKLAEANSVLAGDVQQIEPSTAGLPGKIDPSLTLTLGNVIVILETLVANKLLDRLAETLDWSAAEFALVKAFVDEAIEHLNKRLAEDPERGIHSLSELGLEHTEDASAQGLIDGVVGFVDFLIQAAVQHTSMYNELLGATAFADLVSAIKTLLPG